MPATVKTETETKKQGEFISITIRVSGSCRPHTSFSCIPNAGNIHFLAKDEVSITFNNRASLLLRNMCPTPQFKSGLA